MTTKNYSLFSLALISTAALLAMLIGSSLCQNLWNAPLIFGVSIICFEIAVPIEILKRLKIPARDCNIYAHNIDTIIDICMPPYGIKKKIQPHFQAIGHELLFFLKFTLLVLIPYVLAYFVYYKLHALSEGKQLIISFNYPPQLFYEIITQIFVIALPEELFYRGFLQSAFLRKWPNHKFINGFPLGWAIILTNLIFAVGHLVGSWSPTRLLTFFPGLLFSYLVYKNKSLLSAILFHAACNILGQILYASFYLQ